MRKFVVVVFVCALVIPLAWTQSQESDNKMAATGPPKIIQVFRETVKYGKGSAHEKNEANYPAALTKAKFPYYSLALTAMTGNATEAWYLLPAQTYEDWKKGEELIRKNPELSAGFEKATAADAEFVTDAREWVATYDPELSYRPDFKMGETKFFMVEINRVKPGHNDEFRELRKMINAGHEKNNMDEHMLVYSVNFGAPIGTYIVFQPMKDITDLDMVSKIHNDAYRASLGEDFSKKMKEFNLNGLAMMERNLFSVSPKMSYVSDETAAMAPDFWRPKETMAKTSAKKPASTPAVKKERR